jgi:hypothetical protein
MPYITEIDARNSFITFNDETIYLTQRECAIVKPFCLPIFEASDLYFQVQIDTDIEEFTVQTPIIKVVIGEVQYNVTGVTANIELIADTIYCVSYNFEGSNLLDNVDIGECFNILISFEVDEVRFTATSVQCLQRIPDICFTSKITYSNIEDAFGFIYQTNQVNKIRLPIYFKNPQPQNDQKVYVRSDGTRKKLYARLSKKWLGLVDMTTEEVHQKLVVALSHDNITFVTDNLYSLECTFEDEYNQDFPDVMQGINVWTSNFSVMETPFDEVNNNCG